MRLLAALSLLTSTAAAATARTLASFPNPTWLENLATTRNNSLLLTVIGRAEVYLLPATSSTPSLITTFPNANAVLGIAELAPDLFVVGVGSTTPDQQPVPQSYSVWTIDLLPRHLPPKVAKLADVPDVTLVNGVVALNPNTLLLADSFAGNIVRLDVKTRTTSVVLQDATLAPDFSAQLPLGVNGIRLVGDYLYYSNTVQSLIGRVRIDRWTGKAVGRFEVLVKGGGINQPDDFAVGGDGAVYVTSPLADTIWRVKNGRVGVVKSGDEVAGATSAVFRGGKLVLSTSGLVGGVQSRGGRVVVLDL